MRIVVIEDAGPVGRNLTQRLRDSGHMVDGVAAAPGPDIATAEAFAALLGGVDVLVDLSVPNPCGDASTSARFDNAARHRFALVEDSAVAHHIVISSVGADQFANASAYFSASLALETLAARCGSAHTIVRTTPLFETLPDSASTGEDENIVRISPALVQPVAGVDVAAMLSELVDGAAVNGLVELAGPEKWPFDVLVQAFLVASGDPRQVIADAHALHFGMALTDQSLAPGDAARIGPTVFSDWLAAASPQHWRA